MVMTNMSSTNMVKKTTQGRKKIEIKKIEEVNNRQVTFSKRRAGLFKKASELCVLTGAELAIMVHSPGGRVFAFGHPSPDLVVDKYLTGGASKSSNKDSTTTTKALIQPQPMNEFNQHYSEISKELEKEKKKKENIDESNMMMNNGFLWWDEPIDGLSMEELQQFVPSLEELKKKVLMRADELMMIKSSSLSSKNLVDVNQISSQVGGLANYENMVYGSNTLPMLPLGFDFGHGKI